MTTTRQFADDVREWTLDQFTATVARHGGAAGYLAEAVHTGATPADLVEAVRRQLAARPAMAHDLLTGLLDLTDAQLAEALHEHYADPANIPAVATAAGQCPHCGAAPTETCTGIVAACLPDHP